MSGLTRKFEGNIMSQLQLTIGQYTTKGRKEINQDFHDIRIPKEPELTTKGIAIAIADGISSSKVSQEASKISVSYFLEDYFSTSDAGLLKNQLKELSLLPMHRSMHKIDKTCIT